MTDKKSIWEFKGRVWMFGDDINTDYIMPYFAPGAPGISHEEWKKYCMAAIRPGWADQVQKGDIIMGGRNFGCGSSRSAAHILKLLGLSCLVADSINSLMFRDCVNWAMPALSCRGVSKAFKEGDIAEVNLLNGTIKNITIGNILKTNPIPDFLIDIYEAGGLMPMLEKDKYISRTRIC